MITHESKRLDNTLHNDALTMSISLETSWIILTYVSMNTLLAKNKEDTNTYNSISALLTRLKDCSKINCAVVENELKQCGINLLHKYCDGVYGTPIAG